MKRRKPKLYSTRAELLQAIDDKQHSVAMAIKLSNQYDEEADELLKWMALNPTEAAKTERQKQEWHGRFRRLEICRKESATKQRSVPRLNNELNLLKHALAEFDTEPMPFLGDDTGVRVNL